MMAIKGDCRRDIAQRLARCSKAMQWRWKRNEYGRFISGISGAGLPGLILASGGLLGGRQRIVSPRSLAAMEAVTTAEQAKAFAQADYDAGDVDARTRQEPQPLTLRLSL